MEGVGPRELTVLYARRDPWTRPAPLLPVSAFGPVQTSAHQPPLAGDRDGRHGALPSAHRALMRATLPPTQSLLRGAARREQSVRACKLPICARSDSERQEAR